MTDQAAMNGIALKIARSLELLVRLKIDEIKGFRNRADMIRLLANLRATTPEISSLLGVPITTVTPIVSRGRGSTNPQKKHRSAGGKKSS
jgi:hypothetical protein